MSLKKVITAVAVSAVAAGSLMPVSTVANAHEWDRDSDRHVQRLDRRDRDEGRFNRWGEHRQYNAWRGGDERGYRRHRDHDGRNLAIGAFATVLGIALAAEANRVHDHHYSDRD